MDELRKGDIVAIRAVVFACRGYPRLKEVWAAGARLGWSPKTKPGDEIIKCIHDPQVEGRKRKLWRYELDKPTLGLVTGWSVRKTGDSVATYSVAGDELYTWETEQGYLAVDKTHPVVMVQPAPNNKRWYKPVACLEADVVKVDFVLRVEGGMVSVERNYSYPDALLDAVEGDFEMIIDEDYPSARLASEGTNRVFLVYCSGDVMVEDAYDGMWHYKEVSMGGESLVLEEL